MAIATRMGESLEERPFISTVGTKVSLTEGESTQSFPEILSLTVNDPKITVDHEQLLFFLLVVNQNFQETIKQEDGINNIMSSNIFTEELEECRKLLLQKPLTATLVGAVAAPPLLVDFTVDSIKLYLSEASHVKKRFDDLHITLIFSTNDSHSSREKKPADMAPGAKRGHQSVTPRKHKRELLLIDCRGLSGSMSTSEAGPLNFDLRVNGKLHVFKVLTTRCDWRIS